MGKSAMFVIWNKMAAFKFTPPNDFSLGLIRSHMVVIHLFLMLCDLQKVVRDLCPTLYRVTIKEIDTFNVIGTVSVVDTICIVA
jgi:hypothetical protein